MSTQMLVAGRMSSLPRTKWEVAMRELAIESDILGADTPEQIKTAIVLQRCDRESRLRQLENREILLRTMRIPTLEGELLAAKINVDRWAACARDQEERADKAERRVLQLFAAMLGGLVVIAAGIVFAGAAFA